MTRGARIGTDDIHPLDQPGTGPPLTPVLGHCLNHPHRYSQFSANLLDSVSTLDPWFCYLFVIKRSQSISRLVFLFSRCLLFFPALPSFPKNSVFAWCAQSRAASVCCFWLPMFQAEFNGGTHLLVSLTVHGICRALFQPGIPNKAIFFLSAFFTVQYLHPYKVIENYYGVDDLNFGV